MASAVLLLPQGKKTKTSTLYRGVRKRTGNFSVSKRHGLALHTPLILRQKNPLSRNHLRLLILTALRRRHPFRAVKALWLDQSIIQTPWDDQYTPAMSHEVLDITELLLVEDELWISIERSRRRDIFHR